MTTVIWLIRDTFRQSLASGVFWILLAVTLMATALCLSMRVEATSSPTAAGPDALVVGHRITNDAAQSRQLDQEDAAGHLTVAYGAIRIPLARDVRNTVKFLELILAGGVADTLGVLLTLVWTAGFLPGFLDRRSVSVLLAKPAPRWMLLAGKYAGVLAFVLFHAMLFVGLTWLAIGSRTGIWDAAYLYSIPLLLLHFSVFFSVSLLLAVLTRSTVVCVFGTIVFWFIAWGMNYGRHVLAIQAQVAPSGRFSVAMNAVVDVGYWVLPKPADFGMILYDSLGAKNFFGSAFDMTALAAHGFSLWLSVLTSLAFAAYMLFASAQRFSTIDY
ncbi:MAG TPA: ABC transporter permease subunit [Pirellulales bacterium]|nr:ABC transporter permease subunit [Pirellulales bacterium]